MIDLIAMWIVAALGPEDFSITLPVRPETFEGQRLIAARARAICGDRYPQLGRYFFSGSEALTGNQARESRFEVQQELACLAAPPPVATAERAPADWRPTEADVRQVREMTNRYFALVDAGNAREAFGLWSRAEQAATPLAERAAQLEEFRRQAGTPGEHRIAELTWYVNPEGAPVPGIYVAADYERNYGGLALNCGYLMWFREGEGRYVIIREETGILPRNIVSNAADLEEVRTLMRCPAR